MYTVIIIIIHELQCRVHVCTCLDDTIPKVYRIIKFK